MNSILQALSQFQTEVRAIKRGDDNPFFKSKYASLDSIQQHIKPHLIKCGLIVTQGNIVIDGNIYVNTKVWHTESGEFIESIFPIVVQKGTAQDYGSAVSYAKRYSITGLLNLIVQDEDDDGNYASNKNETKVEVRSEPPSLDQEKYDAMVKFINDGKIKEVESALKKYTLNDSQKKLLTTLINQAKAEAITKQAKK